MGSRSLDLKDAWLSISRCIAEVRSPYTDGFTGRDRKHSLYQLKCFLDSEYPRLPRFTGEEEWEQQRIIDILKKE